jgi:hypothetical protein
MTMRPVYIVIEILTVAQLEADLNRFANDLADPLLEPDCWYLVRCAHFDRRFIIAFRSGRGTCFVDYVEDLEWPLGDVVVEPHTACWASMHGGYNQQAVDALFNDLEQRMLTGDPPEPEHGT